MKQKILIFMLICYLFSGDDSDNADKAESESEGEDGEYLEGVFDQVPLDNSNLIPPDDNPEELPFSPVIDTPWEKSPPSTTMSVDVDVHASASADFDSYLDSTPTGRHVSYVKIFHLLLKSSTVSVAI